MSKSVKHLNNSEFILLYAFIEISNIINITNTKTLLFQYRSRKASFRITEERESSYKAR